MKRLPETLGMTVRSPDPGGPRFPHPQEAGTSRCRLAGPPKGRVAHMSYKQRHILRWKPFPSVSSIRQGLPFQHFPGCVLRLGGVSPRIPTLRRRWFCVHDVLGVQPQSVSQSSPQSAVRMRLEGGGCRCNSHEEASLHVTKIIS